MLSVGSASAISTKQDFIATIVKDMAKRFAEGLKNKEKADTNKKVNKTNDEDKG